MALFLEAAQESGSSI